MKVTVTIRPSHNALNIKRVRTPRVVMQVNTMTPHLNGSDRFHFPRTSGVMLRDVAVFHGPVTKDEADGLLMAKDYKDAYSKVKTIYQNLMGDERAPTKEDVKFGKTLEMCNPFKRKWFFLWLA